jgi:hypothetical protein
MTLLLDILCFSGALYWVILITVVILFVIDAVRYRDRA